MQSCPISAWCILLSFRYLPCSFRSDKLRPVCRVSALDNKCLSHPSNAFCLSCSKKSSQNRMERMQQAHLDAYHSLRRICPPRHYLEISKGFTQILSILVRIPQSHVSRASVSWQAQVLCFRDCSHCYRLVALCSDEGQPGLHLYRLKMAICHSMRCLL